MNSKYLSGMTLKALPLLGALAFAGPTLAITVNVTDFTFLPPAPVTVDDPDANVALAGSAGKFYGSYDDSNAATADLRFGATPDAAGATSFTAYCAELTQYFSFGVTYTDYGMTSGTGYFGAAKTADLSRLFTAFSGSVVNGPTSAAMQAGIWEIIYETGSSYSLGSGAIKVTPQQTNDPVQDRLTFAAFAQVDAVLGRLSSYSTGYAISVLASPNQQDFVLATPAIPEPGTWALLAGGLAGVALVVRRRAPR